MFDSSEPMSLEGWSVTGPTDVAVEALTLLTLLELSTEGSPPVSVRLPDDSLPSIVSPGVTAAVPVESRGAAVVVAVTGVEIAVSTAASRGSAPVGFPSPEQAMAFTKARTEQTKTREVAKGPPPERVSRHGIKSMNAPHHGQLVASSHIPPARLPGPNATAPFWYAASTTKELGWPRAGLVRPLPNQRRQQGNILG